LEEEDEVAGGRRGAGVGINGVGVEGSASGGANIGTLIACINFTLITTWEEN